MLGLSLAKLLLLVALAALVWHFVRHWGAGRIGPQKPPPPRRAPPADGSRGIEAEDMVRCAACGTYVPAKGARPCGRSECPWQGGAPAR